MGVNRIGKILTFYMAVKPSTFDRYAERIFNNTANEVILRVGMVEGFYSGWSPSFYVNDIKVLTLGNEQKIEIPNDFEFEPRRLGSVKEANLYINVESKLDF